MGSKVNLQLLRMRVKVRHSRIPLAGIQAKLGPVCVSAQAGWTPD